MLPKTADVVIIGGGVMGASAAYHLARRNCNDVVLLEKGPLLGMEATGKCAGGIRYQFSTEINVRLSLLSLPMLQRFQEELGQEIDLRWPGYLFLLDNAADLATFRHNVAMQNRLGVPSEILSAEDARAKAPLLYSDDIIGAAWHEGDGLADPNGVVQGYAAGARRLGAKTLTGVEAMAIRVEAGRVSAVETSAGVISTREVVNAAGPWIDYANDALGQETHFIGGTKGSHLVLDHPELHAAIGGHEFFFENDDGRIVLIYPLLDKVMVGTSDIPIDDPDEARCTEEEVDYFFALVKRVFPTITVDRSHIVFRFSGVRPLPSSKAATAGQISRDHSIELLKAGENGRSYPIYNLIGGKWTTFRAFAEQAADQVLHHLGHRRQQSTKPVAIGGGRDYPRTAAEQAQWLTVWHDKTGVSKTRLRQLFDRYGTRAAEIATFITQGDDAPLTHHPGYSQREIIFLAQTEKVVHLDDLILRRSLLGMLGEVTAGLVGELTAVVAPILHWNPTRQQAEIARTKTLLADKHGVMLDH